MSNKENTINDLNVINFRGPLLIHFGIPTQVFFSETRRQKRSLTSINEYFGNAVAGKKNQLGNKIELLEVPFRTLRKELLQELSK